MAHPGRPRKRNKPVPQPIPHQQIPQHYLKPIKGEPTANFHDESDLISFRADASSRLIMNQELMENVTSKYIHSSKIIPPSSFPDPLPQLELDSLKHDDVYFGDLKLLKQASERLEKELNSSEKPVSFGEEYDFQQQSTLKLAQLAQNIHSQEDIDKLEQEMKTIAENYKAKFHRKIVRIDSIKPYKASIDVKVDVAPENYDPKLLNSMINMNQTEAAPESSQNQALNQNSNPSQNQNFNNNDYLNSFLEFQQIQLKDDMLNDMVDDDMGGLINFQGDEEMMNQNFDEDFLSQIDHSME